MANKDNKERKTRKFYEMLQKRHNDAKNHPEKLVPLEDVAITLLLLHITAIETTNTTNP